MLRTGTLAEQHGDFARSLLLVASQQGLVGSGSMGAAPHSSGMGGPSAGQLQLMGNASEQLPMQPMAAGPSVSEHSRASRPVKRANGMGLGDLALGAAGMGSMGPDAANLPPRSMSYPVPGVARGGSGVDDGGTGGGGSYTQAGGDLQQRLSSLQNQVGRWCGGNCADGGKCFKVNRAHCQAVEWCTLPSPLRLLSQLSS